MWFLSIKELGKKVILFSVCKTKAYFKKFPHVFSVRFNCSGMELLFLAVIVEW